MNESSASRECLSDDELLDVLEGSLTGDHSEAHLASCQVCRVRLESLSGEIPADLGDRPSCEVTSAALNEAMANLCSIRPARGGASYAFLKPSDAPNQLGTLGKYEIRQVIGQGGMGVVFDAFDPSLRREVAIKVPTSSLVATKEAHDRFLREVRAIASVRDDNIVTVHAVEDVDGTPFLVMERIHGKSLDQEIRQRQRLPFDEVLRIAEQASAALRAAHASGLVHRDIKPANILLEADSGRVKVTDFGLAKSDADVSITATGILAGTPEFMAPEQATQDEVTARSDLFSLGVVLYTALTGESPFRGKNALSTMQRLCTETPTPVIEKNPNVPAWFGDLLTQMMSKDVNDRPQSAAEVSNVISNRTALSSTKPDDAAHTTAGRHQSIFKLGLAIALFGMIVLTIVFWPPGNQPNVKAGFYLSDEHYAELGPAILASADGDVITVTGNGPYPVPGFQVDGKRLTIQAANQSKPVFETSDSITGAEVPFITATEDLTLEGLDIRWRLKSDASGGGNSPNALSHCAVTVVGGELSISHCRIVCEAITGCVGATSDAVHIEDSHLIADAGPCVAWDPTDKSQLTLRNSVLEGGTGLFCMNTQDAEGQHLTLTKNTFQTSRGIQLVRPRARLPIVATQNAFDAEELLVLVTNMQKMLQVVQRTEVVRQLRTYVDWSGNTNAVGRSTNFYSRSRPGINQRTRPEVSSLSDWQSIWGPSSGMVEVEFEYEAVDIGNGVTRRQLTSILSESAEGLDGIGADATTAGP